MTGLPRALRGGTCTCVTLLQVQRCGEVQDLPDAESIRAYACTLPDALPLLQSELQPVSARIGQAGPAVQLAQSYTQCLARLFT